MNMYNKLIIFHFNKPNKNMEMFTPNSDIHTKNTRSKSNLFLPQTRLTKYQKAVYLAGIKIFNCLPENIKNTF